MDRQLIDLLRANGRATYAELARQVGLSSPAVHERVAKLEAAGVITGYRAVIDPAAVGLDVTALVGVMRSSTKMRPGWRPSSTDSIYISSNHARANSGAV